MVKHICGNCGKEFERKSDYIYHTEKKKYPCVSKDNISNNNIAQNAQKIAQSNVVTNKVNIIEQEENQNPNTKSDHEIEVNSYFCKYCGLSFQRSNSVSRHMKLYCKVKKLKEEEKEKIFNKLIEKEEKIDVLLKNYESLEKNNANLQKHNESLQKQLKDLQKQLKNQSKEYEEKIKNVISKNITKNVHNNNNLTQNIIISSPKLVRFGEEDLKRIDVKYLENPIKNIKKTGKYSFIQLLQNIHFNPEYPEYQNIYMNDKNRKQFMTYNGDDWELKKKNVIYEILEQIKDFYDLKFEEIKYKVEKNPKLKDLIHCVFKKYYDMVYDENEDETNEDIRRKENFKEMVNNEIELCLYNNKDKVIENFEKLKEDAVQQEKLLLENKK